jgi:acetolactate synthase I/II/III large subunit
MKYLVACDKIFCQWCLNREPLKHTLPPQSFRCRGVAQLGSAPGLGPGGRRFESSLPDHQEQSKPTRATGINDLVNPDFASYGEAFGAKGLRIRAPEEAGPVLEQALAHRGPVVVDVDSRLENLSAQNTISDLQAAE